VGKILFVLKQLILGIFAFVVMWLLFRGNLSDSAESVFIVVVVAVMLLGTGLLQYIRSTRVTTGAPTRRPRDASKEGHLPESAASQNVVAQLEKMGFTRMGETGETIPGHGEGFTWLLGNPDRTITVEVVDRQDGLCQFTTVFEDQAVIETSYPIGEHINKPNYYSRKNTTGLPQTYKAHVEEAKALIPQHGRPKSTPSIAAILEWDEIYRERYVRYKITNRNSRRSLLISIGIIIVLIVLTRI
jgi:hypothetical protein